MFAFDDEATVTLRQVGLASNGRRAVPDDLHRALAEPTTGPLQPTRLKVDPSLTALLRRAATIAGERGAHQIGRTDLAEAVVEDAARSYALDLDRLRFARWRVERTYPELPARRTVRAKLMTEAAWALTSAEADPR